MRPAPATWSWICLALLLCAIATASARADEWRWKRRVDLSILHDSNVFESVSDGRDDLAGRFQIHLNGRSGSKRNLALAMECKGGLELYKRHSDDSRLVGDLRLRCEGRLSSRFWAGLACQGRGKLFPGADRDYAVYRAWPSLIWAMSDRTRSRLFCFISRLDYWKRYEFDYTQFGIGLSVERSLSDHFTGKLRYSLSVLDFERPALDYRETSPDILQWIDIGAPQEDTRHEINASLEIYRWVLLNCDISYAFNRSNAYGYAHDLLRIQILLAKTLPRELTVRIYWTAYLKKYIDPLQPLLQLRPDSEHDDNSYTLVDLSRDIGRSMSLGVRFGYYRNESAFRDLYYEKVVLSTGITRRF